MYYAITEQGVKKAYTRPQLNKKVKGLLENAEFKYCGRDAVTILNEKDLEFIQDKRRLSQIPVQQLYKRDTTKVILFIILLVQFICLIKG